MRALLACLLWTFSAGLAIAQCGGSDLRASLDDDTRAEVAALVEAMPHAEGNHWIARRGESEIHLIGTMHVDDPRFDAVAGRLRPVIAGARLLLLEATEEQQQALTEELARDPMLFVLQETTLPELLSEADWTALAAAAEARGIPGFMAAKFKPWYLSLVLAMPPCMTADLAMARGLDMRLQELATETNTPTAALEDPKTVFAAFEAVPLEEQAAMILPSVMPAEDAEDLFATIRAAYFEEKTAESWALSSVLAARLSPAGPEIVSEAMGRTEAALLRDRNLAWLPVILAEAGAEPIVVAAGAAHLPGREGLLQLLADAGFTLERADF